MSTPVVRPIAILFFATTWMAEAHAADFKKTIAYAHAHHPALKAERENANAARTGIAEAYAGFLPTAIINYEHGRDRFEFDDIPPQRYKDVTNRSLNVTQPIFNGGGTISQIRTARALSKAEEARLRATEQTVLLNAITAFANLAEAQEVLDASRKNVGLLTEHLGGTRTRFEAREVTVSDVALSEARMARAEAELSMAEGNYAAARETYRREIGLMPDTVAMPPLPPYIPSQRSEVEAKAAQHPELLAVQHEEKAAGSAVGTRLATLLPKVSLNGSMEDRNGLTNLTPTDRLREDALLLRVTIPIFQSGAEYAQLRKARYQSARAKYVTHDTRLITQETALRAWEDFLAAKGRLRGSEAAQTAASKALNGIREEYNFGTRTTFDMLDTQQEFYASRIDLLRTQTDYVLSAYRLLAAIGMLNPKTLQLTAPAAKPAAAASPAPPTSAQPADMPSVKALVVPASRQHTIYYPKPSATEKGEMVTLGQISDKSDSPAKD